MPAIDRQTMSTDEARASGFLSAHDLQPTLGARLKELRLSRGLSMREVAAGTGLSSSFISLVELGRTELTIGRLVALADFYEVGLRHIVATRDLSGPVVVRRADREGFDSADHSVRTELLASWHLGDLITGFLRFEVGAELTEAARQVGPQFVLVLSGELMITFSDSSSVALQEGDSVCFEASRRHRLSNIGADEVQIVTFKKQTTLP